MVECGGYTYCQYVHVHVYMQFTSLRDAIIRHCQTCSSLYIYKQLKCGIYFVYIFSIYIFRVESAITSYCY